MKLIDAIDLAKACGLKTVKEAFSNVDLHAMNIFSYTKIYDELKELRDEIVELYIQMNIDSREDITIEAYEKFLGGKK